MEVHYSSPLLEDTGYLARTAETLRTTIRIEKLSLSITESNAAAWRVLFDALVTNKSVWHLTVESEHWEGDYSCLMDSLARVVRETTTIRELVLHPGGGDLSFALIEAINKSATITALTIYRSRLSSTQLAHLLAGSPRLIFLDLSRTRYTLAIPTLPPALRTLVLRGVAYVNSSYLWSCPLDELVVGIIHFTGFNAPVRARKLTLCGDFWGGDVSPDTLIYVEDLTLESMVAKETMVVAVVNALRAGRLGTLTLINGSVGAHDTNLLTRAIRDSPTLHTLTVRVPNGYGFDQSHLRMVLACPSLTAMHLTGPHHLSDSMLATAVHKLTSLTIDGVRFGKDMPELVNAVATTQTLLSLRLIPFAAYQPMIETLIRTASPTLQTLVLREYTPAVLAGLTHNRALRSIKFSRDWVTSEVAKLLARNVALAEMRTMVMCARRQRLPRLPEELLLHLHTFNVRAQ